MEHGFPPIYNGDSKILILGSFPSVASRKVNFYYGHPRNRFWPLLGELFGPVPKTRDGKIAYLLAHDIALYDAVASCKIKGSLDAHMKEAKPQDLGEIFEAASIRAVFANGAKAFEMAQVPEDIPLFKLPSTSAANAAYQMGDLIDHWQVIQHYMY